MKITTRILYHFCDNFWDKSNLWQSFEISNRFDGAYRCERSESVGKSDNCDISSRAFFFHQMNPHSEPMFFPESQNEKSLAKGRRWEFEVSLGKPTVVSQLAVSHCFAPWETWAADVRELVGGGGVIGGAEEGGGAGGEVEIGGGGAVSGRPFPDRPWSSNSRCKALFFRSRAG